MAKLPARLDTAVVRVAVTPTSPLVEAWGSPSAPVVVRCGVGLPASYQLDAQLTALNIDNTGEVGWFAEDRGSMTVLTSVRRPVKIELTLPKSYRADVVLGSVTKVVAKYTPKGSDGS